MFHQKWPSKKPQQIVLSRSDPHQLVVLCTEGNIAIYHFRHGIWSYQTSFTQQRFVIVEWVDSIGYVAMDSNRVVYQLKPPLTTKDPWQIHMLTVLEKLVWSFHSWKLPQIATLTVNTEGQIDIYQISKEAVPILKQVDTLRVPGNGVEKYCYSFLDPFAIMTTLDKGFFLMKWQKEEIRFFPLPQISPYAIKFLQICGLDAQRNLVITCVYGDNQVCLYVLHPQEKFQILNQKRYTLPLSEIVGISLQGSYLYLVDLYQTVVSLQWKKDIYEIL
jgi:hypothetical protein